MENLTKPNHDSRHSTYQLLVESEEKQRNAFESVAYLLLIVAMSAALWQFSNEPVAFTGLGLAASKTVAAQPEALRS